MILGVINYFFYFRNIERNNFYIRENSSKGIKKAIVFFSSDILVFSDDLTVSMTEYVIYYYYAKYGIHAYIDHAEKKEKIWRLDYL